MLHLALAFAMLCWAGGWVALKILTSYTSFEIITFWRFAIMFVAFIPLLFYFNKPLSIPKKSLPFIGVGALLNVLFMITAFWGVTYGTASSGGVMITTLSPLFTFLLMVVLYRYKLTANQYLGLFLGLIGASIMIGLTPLTLNNLWVGGNGYFLLSALIWALVTLLSQRSHVYIHPIHYSFLISGVALGILTVSTWHAPLGIIFTFDITFWVALLYLGIFGQTIATTIFFIASGKLGSGITSSFMFLVPVFTPLLGLLILGETLRLEVATGGFVILFALGFINRRTPKATN